MGITAEPSDKEVAPASGDDAAPANRTAVHPSCELVDTYGNSMAAGRLVGVGPGEFSLGLKLADHQAVVHLTKVTAEASAASSFTVLRVIDQQGREVGTDVPLSKVPPGSGILVSTKFVSPAAVEQYRATNAQRPQLTKQPVEGQLAAPCDAAVQLPVPVLLHVCLHAHDHGVMFAWHSCSTRSAGFGMCDRV